MITKLDRSQGNTLGFAVSGDVTKADYDVLVPAVEAALTDADSVRLLLDMTEFHWEKVGAWGADLSFGHEFHQKIARMALVGNKNWERHLAHLAQPFYAVETAFFEDADQAWTWVAAGGSA